MKDKILQLLYDMVRAIISSKNFVPFIFDLIKGNFKVIVVCFLCGVAIVFTCFALTGCVMGDKAVQEMTATIKECVGGVCYGKR